MTGTTRSSAGLDERRRRLLYRAWHRGTREMDLILGGFAETRLDGLSESELADFEALLDAEDDQAFGWFCAGAAPPPFDTPLFAKIAAFHREARR